MKLNLFFLLFVSIIYGQNKFSGKFETQDAKTTKGIKLEYENKINLNPYFNQNNKISIYITENHIFQNTQFSDKTNDEDLLANKNSIIILSDTSEKEKYNQILIDINSKELTEYTRELVFLENEFAVQENLPFMNWELITEQKQIGEFLCEKAKTTFRGRTYEVWYTTEIPITYGPWKFNGLPGLMIEINDIQSLYKWQLTAYNPNATFELNTDKIYSQNANFEKITFKDFDKKIINKRKDDYIMMQSRNSDNNIKLSFDTLQDKEPINEWRSQTYWEF